MRNHSVLYSETLEGNLQGFFTPLCKRIDPHLLRDLADAKDGQENADKRTEAAVLGMDYISDDGSPEIWMNLTGSHVELPQKPPDERMHREAEAPL